METTQVVVVVVVVGSVVFDVLGFGTFKTVHYSFQVVVIESGFITHVSAGGCTPPIVTTQPASN